MKLRYLITIILAAFISGIAVAEPTVYLQNKPNVVVTADQPTFTIKLASNPTTGYSWFLREYHPTFLTPVRHKFEPASNKALMGAPGFELWTFHVKREAFVVPQQTILRFVYVRPWEAPGRTQQVVFRVSSVAKH